MTYGEAPPPPPPPPPPPAGRAQWPTWAPVALIVAAVALVGIGIAVFSGGGGDRSPDSTLAGPTTSATSTTSATTTSTTTTPTTTSSTTTTTTLPPGPQPGGTWTLMVFMLGDNNLEPALFGDLEEMALLPQTENLTILTLIDRHEEYSEREMYNIPDWTGVKLLRVGQESLEELADYGELDLGDPAVLRDFVVTSIQTAPADHYGLVLWDHGAINGVGNDDSSGDGLDPFEISDAIGAALEQTGVDRLDFIGFDACLMGAYEIATAIEPHAYYMIASEETEPNGGWNYGAFDYVAFNPEGTVEGLGSEILERFVELEAEGSPHVTLSMIDLSRIDGIDAALVSFTDAVAADMDRFASTIGRVRRESTSFGSSPNPDDDWFLVDLGDFMQRVASAEPDLASAAEAVRAAIDAAVVDNRTGPIHAGAEGIAVFFPPIGDYWVPQFEPLIPDPWEGFVTAFYAAGAAIPDENQPDIVEAGDQATYVLDADGLSVTADFNIAAEDTAVEVTLYNGIPDADGTIVYFEQSQGLIEGVTAFGFYDLTVLVLGDGEDEAYGYTDISFSADQTLFTVDVPVAYYPPGSDEWIDAVISVVFDSTTDTFTETMYQIQDDFWGVLEPEPDGLIYPWLLWEYPDGTLEWNFSSDIGLWADLDNLSWEWVTLDPGTDLYSELWVCDYGGNCDWAWVQTVAGTEGGTGDSKICRNTWWGFEFAYPSWLTVWSADDPQFACESFLDGPFSAASDSDAYDEAILTVEVIEGDVLAGAIDFIAGSADYSEDLPIPGLETPATFFIDEDPGSETYGYLIPVTDAPEGPAFLIVGWEFLAPGTDLRTPVDAIISTLLIYE